MSDPCQGGIARYLSDNPGVERLLDNVQATVPGLTDEMLAMVVWNTIEDFYQSSTYRREHAYWRMQPGQIVIDFDPYDSHWRVCRFMGFNGLDRVKFEPPGRVRDLTSPTPESERKGEILLALKPASYKTPLPYNIWTNYFEALYNGVMGRLYMQPAKPYTDPATARLCISLYRKGIAGARAEAQAQHVREGSEWSYPYFATGGYPSGRGTGGLSVRG